MREITAGDFHVQNLEFTCQFIIRKKVISAYYSLQAFINKHGSVRINLDELIRNSVQTGDLTEANRISHYLIRKIKRKLSLDNVDWTLASKPITYEIKTRAYLMNELTTLEK